MGLDKFLPKEALKELEDVLEFGDIKHPGELWKQQTEDDHIVHARDHIYKHIGYGTPDEESKKSHLAHAAVRCIMALAIQKQNTCGYCGHSLINNSHGPDQNDLFLDENDNLVLGGICTYCKICCDREKK